MDMDGHSLSSLPCGTEHERRMRVDNIQLTRPSASRANPKKVEIYELCVE